MSYKFALNTLLLLSTIISCSPNQYSKRAKVFDIAFESITADTVINTAIYHSGFILCLQSDQKLFVIDTNFNFADSLTSIFSKLRIKQLYNNNDTTLITTEHKTFIIDSTFALIEHQIPSFNYGLPLYNDSNFSVSACSFGEWGGSVYFFDKKNKKTFAHPANSVQQVLKHNGHFIISCFLSHMVGNSTFISIENPAKLYEIKNEQQKTNCTWYLSDSLEYLQLKANNQSQLVHSLILPYNSSTITTFVDNQNLFSIYSTDSATILAQHTNDSIIPIDTLIKRSIHFSSARTNVSNNISVTAYGATWATGNEHNIVNHFQNTGIIFIKDNRITFLEVNTPHQWVGQNRNK